VVPAAMITVGIAYLIMSRTSVSIYQAQWLNRDSGPQGEPFVPR